MSVAAGAQILKMGVCWQCGGRICCLFWEEKLIRRFSKIMPNPIKPSFALYIYIPLASFERPLIPWILDMASLAMRSKVVPKPLWPPESESGPSLLDIIDSFGSFSITFA